MQVVVEPARQVERSVLENLMSLYLHDFSEHFGTPPGPEGRFVYERLPLYFKEAGRHPFLIRAGGELAGFALVSRGSLIRDAPDVFDLSEFFVVRGLRRRGVGREAAGQVFRSFPGTWEVRALDRNPGAGEFWAEAIARHTGDDFREEPWESQSGTWRVFSFEQG